MQRTTGPLAALRRATRGRPDEGLTMVELLMAIVIFGIAATAIMGGFLTALKSTRADRNRIQASSLAAREIEITRNEFFASPAGPANLSAADYLVNPHPLPGGTAGAALRVDNAPYTVVRNVEPLIAGTGVSPCNGGSAVKYPQFQVNVTVTWPSMGGVKPVTNTTILTPPKGTISTTLGYATVKVVDSSGAPSSGRTVTMTGPGGTDTDNTGSDGCAVFPEATPGTYTASLNDLNYVDFYGSQTPSKSGAVTTGGLLQMVPFNYDKKARLDVTLSTDPTYALPTGYGTIKPTVVLSNTALLPLQVKPVVLSGANGGSIDGLYPFTDGYGAWVGSCSQSKPAATTATVIAPNANAPLTIRLAPVKVTLVGLLSAPVSGATIVAAPLVSSTGCVAGESIASPLVLGVTDSTGTLMTSLPAGTWTLKSITGLHITPVGGVWPTTTSLQPTSAATAVAMAVTL
jgi:prepilin-type N-terminal cleavage/methylation domain-containing protein